LAQSNLGPLGRPPRCAGKSTTGGSRTFWRPPGSNKLLWRYLKHYSSKITTLRSFERSISLWMRLTPSGLRIQILRRKFLLSQKQFAAFIDCSVDGIKAIEQGRYRLSAQLSRKIERATGVPFDWLTGKDSEFPDVWDMAWRKVFLMFKKRFHGDSDRALNATLDRLLDSCESSVSPTETLSNFIWGPKAN
jgi:transcriptional regulator with XRE-family HTH domain